MSAHQIHHDPAVNDLIARERRAAAAEAWDEAIEAVAWRLDNGEPSAAAALAYTDTAKHNPHRADETGATR